MILEKFYPFTKQLKWLLIAAPLLTIISIGYQPLRIMVEQQRLFYQIDQMARNTRQDEDSTRPFDPWQDLIPLNSSEGRAVAQQALIEAQHLVTVTPYNTEAFRHLGRAAILADQPDIAISAFSRAVEQRPDSPLIWFELGIAYEQLAPSEMVGLTSLYPDEIPWEWLGPPPVTQEWSLSLAPTTSSDWWIPITPIKRTVFVDNQITFRTTLPTNPVVLSFWVSDYRNETAVYNVTLNKELIRTFTIPPAADIPSWHHVHVDMSSWGGQTATITLSTNSSQPGWGELQLIDRTAIACIQVDCLQRATAAWAQGGFTATDFLQTGMVAFRQKQYAEALRWFTRAAISGADVASTVWYTRYLMTNESDALIQSVTFDRGWNSAEMRLRAWVRWASILHDAQRFAEVERGLRHVLDTTAQDDRSVDWLLSEVYRRLGVALWVQDRPGEALPFAMKAVELNDRSVWAHIHYGKILYFSDPGQVHQTEQAFAKALALDSRPQIWLNLIGFWKWVKESERAIALCRQAQRQGLSEEIQSECK
ncbi:MAG: tetratricopeptide repeat protein [Chloroflexus sp.]|nr:tetratricopeptide repeat protein [Chloroflexus sp.]